MTRKTAERGDVVVALLSIQQIKHLPDDFHMVTAELLSQEGSTRKEEVVKFNIGVCSKLSTTIASYCLCKTEF